MRFVSLDFSFLRDSSFYRNFSNRIYKYSRILDGKMFERKNF